MHEKSDVAHLYLVHEKSDVETLSSTEKSDVGKKWKTNSAQIWRHPPRGGCGSDGTGSRSCGQSLEDAAVEFAKVFVIALLVGLLTWSIHDMTSAQDESYEMSSIDRAVLIR